MKKFGTLPLLFSCFMLLNAFAPYAQSEQIKVLVFNTWGVPLITEDHQRFPNTMKQIEELNPDVVVLTEVFTKKGKRNFISTQYPHQAQGGRAFPRPVGSGLRILSKFPIHNRATLTFNNCKKSDCLSKKGAVLVTLTSPTGKLFNLVATHLNSAGGAETRNSQLNQLARFAEDYEDAQAPTLIAGDFNFGPESTEAQHAVQKLQTQDAWTQTQSHDAPGYTYDCFENSYARDYAIRTRDLIFRERLDYLFYRGAIEPVSTQLVFNQPGQALSDHYGVLGTFELN
jgi:endonuclease/exonuclease/phosphatase family metal-dependent hydrolase